MRTFKKKPLLYSQQMEILKERGLLIENEKKAERYLSEISYYRLSAYFIPFQKTKDLFDANTNFENCLSLYLFDRELRLLVFDAIERIEVAIRTQMIYTLSHKYNDSHWQDNAALFKPAYTNPRTAYTTDIFADTQAIIKKHIDAKHPEVFIRHYITEYNAPANPPSWMCLELLTIGELSRLYSALKDNADKQTIAGFFGLHHTIFTSWLHTLVYVRNICAHHSRLWNREFAIKPEVLQKPQRAWLQKAFDDNNHRTFYFLCILKYLLGAANPTNHFKQKLESLMLKYPNTPIQFMGIPTIDRKQLIDWKEEALWK
jgi:abortive infection bacteriophage resistance protein